VGANQGFLAFGVVLGRRLTVVLAGARGLGGVFSIRVRTTSRSFLLDFAMAPQPLSRVKASAVVSWGQGALKSYPHLCSIVMEAISFGAQVEFNWSAIIVDLLRAEAKTGMAMYQALSGAEARRTALSAAAKIALSPDDFILFQSVEKALRSARRARNNFVHHIWGTSDQVPDALLLIDPACLLDFEVRKSSDGEAREIDNSLIAVWKQRDLESAREAIRDGLSVVGGLARGLLENKPAIAIGDLARQHLLSWPAIAQAVEHHNQKKHPQAPPRPLVKKRPEKK
jgi:hypothetical protein